MMKAEKKASNKGGDEVDYLYDRDGNEIDSKKVKFGGITPGDIANGNLLKSDDGIPGQLEYEGYGVRGWSMATGAITPDNTLFEMYAGGKTIGAAFTMTKVPLFRAVGSGISKYMPSLNRGKGLRNGISKARNINANPGTRKVFRATYGNRQKHFFDIDIGKWGK